MLWAKKAGDNGESQWCDLDADTTGVTLCGYFYSASIQFGSYTLTNDTSRHGSTPYLARYDSAGNVIWAKEAGEGNIYPRASLAPDRIGGLYLMSGFADSILTLGPLTVSNTSKGQFDILLARTGNSSGIGKLSESINSLRIFPNPGTGKFNIQIPGKCRVEVYSMTGQQIYSGTFDSIGTKELDLSVAPAGLYQVFVTLDREVMKGKIMKK